MSDAGGILAGYESLRAGQEAFYKDLHQHSELSRAEHRTARRVAGHCRMPGIGSIRFGQRQFTGVAVGGPLRWRGCKTQG